MKKQLLYEGKAKRIYSTEEDDLIIQEFKNSLTAFNGKKKAEIEEKGAINCEISSRLFSYLEKKGIKTHFVKKLSPTEMLVKKLRMIPLEVVVRNLVTGSLKKRTGMKEGEELSKPVIEFYLKNDELGDPMLNKYHILTMNILGEERIEEIVTRSFIINEYLKEFLFKRNILLVDFKLEYGFYNDELMVGDEISPDTCRFWDKDTKESLDKDVFRFDKGDVLTAYRKVLERIT